MTCFAKIFCGDAVEGMEGAPVGGGVPLPAVELSGVLAPDLGVGDAAERYYDGDQPSRKRDCPHDDVTDVVFDVVHA